MSSELLVDSRRPDTHLNAAELWRYRDLFLVLIRRDIAVRYQKGVLGILWALGQPLAMMAVFTLVFARFAGVDSGTVPYPLFALSGLLPWLFFSQTLQAAGSSVLNSRTLIQKVYFPRLLIPLTAIGIPFMDFCISSGLLFGLVLYYGVGLTVSILLFPVMVVIAAMTAIGVGCLVAALTAAYRDLRNLLPFLVLTWLFLTPVVYPSALIPHTWRWLLLLNPMAGVVDGMRSAWLGLPFDWPQIALSALIAAIVFWAGTRTFRAIERSFADTL